MEIKGLTLARDGTIKILSRACFAKSVAEKFSRAGVELAFIYAAGLAVKYTELPIMRSLLMMTSKKKCPTFL